MGGELYKIRFPNGKIYIGITSVGVRQRFAGHCRSASNGSRLPVHAAIRKYGAESVSVSVEAAGDIEAMKLLEIDTIRAMKATDRMYGYNVSNGGDTSPMHSAEVAAQVSASKRERIATDPEYAESMRNHGLRLCAPELREKANAAIRTDAVSAAKSRKLTGYKHTEQARANMSAAQRRPEAVENRREKSTAAWASEALRAEQSARLKGRTLSDEHKEKIRIALMGHPGAGKGVPRSEEVRQKISLAKMGHLVSDEARARMSAAQKRRFASKGTAPIIDDD